MNLEVIERCCVKYLEQVSNPLVPLDSLIARLREDEACPAFTDRELLDFLREHELFTVIDPPADAQDPEVAAELAVMGIPVGTRVILVDRMPSRRDIGEMVQQQLAAMTEALAGALHEAHETGNKDMEDKVLDTLARAERLRKIARDTLDG